MAGVVERGGDLLRRAHAHALARLKIEPCRGGAGPRPRERKRLEEPGSAPDFEDEPPHRHQEEVQRARSCRSAARANTARGSTSSAVRWP